MRNLHVLVTADPELPVPPRLYGGIERIIHLLVEGLTARGHDVTLIAHRDSVTTATLIPYPAETSRGLLTTARHAALVTSAALRIRPDILQSFGRVAYLAPLLPLDLRKVMSYQRAVTPRTVKWASKLAGSSLLWTACSRHIANPVERLGTWRVIYNSVPVDRMPFTTSVPADAPLMFLGRLEAIKGAHVAIDIAKASGRKLILAGNVPDDPQSRAYFDEQVRSRIDGESVVYIGPVDDAMKSRWLARSAALLMPIQWDEPFGIVMAEALASGTPVIGLGRGAVPEVIEDGLTGFVCQTAGQMVTAVSRVGEVSRARCRQAAEHRFSQAALVDAYESLYRQLIDRRAHSRGTARQAIKA